MYITMEKYVNSSEICFNILDINDIKLEFDMGENNITIYLDHKNEVRDLINNILDYDIELVFDVIESKLGVDKKNNIRKLIDTKEKYKKFYHNNFAYIEDLLDWSLDNHYKLPKFDPKEFERMNEKHQVRKPFTKSIRHEVFKRDNYKCVECGATKEETTLEVDHILPVVQGGTDELDNLQTLCKACNLSKFDRCWKGKFKEVVEDVCN